MKSSDVEIRVDELLALVTKPQGDLSVLTNEVYSGTVAIVTSLYGNSCEQMRALKEMANGTFIKYTGSDIHCENMLRSLAGVLKNVKSELNSGFIGTLQKNIAGDILSDFIQLAKSALEQSGDPAKNVASVLAAAAYEDTIRRMGTSFAGIIGRDDLSKVIEALKNAGILVAPQLGIALSYLNFRNHALHAEWDKIDRASVQSVLGFVEQLLLIHFS